MLLKISERSEARLWTLAVVSAQYLIEVATNIMRAASVCRWRFGRLCLTPVKVSGHIYFVREKLWKEARLMVKRKVFGKTVLTLLEEKRYKELKDIFSSMNPVDIAGLLQGFSEKNILLLFRILPKGLAAETFVEMDYDQQEVLIGSFSDTELHEVVNELILTLWSTSWRKCRPM